MTNESDTYAQAEPGKAPGSTFERKEMSFKTLRKRIALVAVSALAITGLSTVPANAVVTPPVYISTATTVGGTALSATTLAAGVSFTKSPVNASAVATITAPAGTAIVFTLTSAAAFVATDIADIQLNGVTYVRDTSVTAATSTAITSLTTPSTPGTYNGNIRIYAGDGTTAATANNSSAGGVFDIGFTLTLTALSDFSVGTSTTYLEAATDGSATALNDAAFRPIVNTASTHSASMSVDLNRGDSSAYAVGTYYVYVEGPGLIDIADTITGTATDVDSGTAGNQAATWVRSESIATDDSFNVLISGDGTSGTGTLKQYVILADGVTKVNLPDKKVTFYGSIAKLEATLLQGIATPGAANGCKGQNTCTQATLALTPAIVVKATDSNGTIVPGASLTANITDSAVIASVNSDGAVNGTTDKNGFGYYNYDVTGGAVVSVGKSTTVNFSIVVGTATIKSNDVTVTLAGTPAKVALSLDKASYAPGEKGTITVTVTDATGKPAADGTYANLFAGASATNLSVQGSTPAASVEVLAGKATYTFYAPVQSGTFTITNTGGSSVAAAGQIATSASASIANPADAQIAALVAAIAKLQKAINKIQKRLNR